MRNFAFIGGGESIIHDPVRTRLLPKKGKREKKKKKQKNLHGSGRKQYRQPKFPRALRLCMTGKVFFSLKPAHSFNMCRRPKERSLDP